MDMQQRLENLLAALGNDPDEIAAKLADEGCFGVQEPECCPLAVYVANKLTPTEHAYVGASGDVFVGRNNRPYRPYRAKTDGMDFPAVSEFVSNFDNRHYPFLEAE